MDRIYRDLVAERPGEDDDRVERTDNSLRPADLAYDQPPQDPEWTPDEGTA